MDIISCTQCVPEIIYNTSWHGQLSWCVVNVSLIISYDTYTYGVYKKMRNTDPINKPGVNSGAREG